MSLLIQMDLPKPHDILYVGEDFMTADLYVRNDSQEGDEEVVWYPIIEIPPHGRLIDADEAINTLKELGSREYRREKGTIADAIKMLSSSVYTPTIIPGDKEG